MSIPQVYYSELAQKRKYCSLRTMQRIAAQLRSRDGDDYRHQTRQPRKKPQGYVATRPCSVLCYTVIDLFSRYILGHHVFDKQTAKNAKALLKGVFDTYKLKMTGAVLHSDNGSQMKAKCVKKLLQSYGVTESHSRPSVSDDNAFMESFYHTIKSALGLNRFVFEDGDVDKANQVVSALIDAYHTRFHSGINFATPEARFYGYDHELIAAFNEADDAYSKANPERFRNHPHRAAARTVAQAPVLNPSVDRESLEVGGNATSQSK